MKRSLVVFMFFVPLFFLSESLSAKSDLGLNFPSISNPDFSIRNRIVKFSFDYENVAGSIQDARITLVVSTPIKGWKDRLEPFQFVLGGWRGFFWSAEDNFKLTRGRITAKFELPWYAGINHETNINGFGLAVADARKLISNAPFINGEIDRETRWMKIYKFIKEALT